jgi:hypothetical protein
LPHSENVKLLGLVALSAISFALFESYSEERLTNTELCVAKSRWSYWVNLRRGMLGFTAGWIVFASFNERGDLYARILLQPERARKGRGAELAGSVYFTVPCSG